MEKPIIDIEGLDSNIFVILAKCCRALREAGEGDKVVEMQQRVLQSKSYSLALSICTEYVSFGSGEDAEEHCTSEVYNNKEAGHTIDSSKGEGNILAWLKSQGISYRVYPEDGLITIYSDSGLSVARVFPSEDRFVLDGALEDSRYGLEQLKVELPDLLKSYNTWTF
jgi:hypothetical protein